jgi:hypothetical protein
MYIQDDQIPYFAWDRQITAGQIRNRLDVEPEQERIRLAAWIMREAAPADVWQFLSPRQAQERFSSMKMLLGRKKDFWSYILSKWHELGRI